MITVSNHGIDVPWWEVSRSDWTTGRVANLLDQSTAGVDGHSSLAFEATERHAKHAHLLCQLCDCLSCLALLGKPMWRVQFRIQMMIATLAWVIFERAVVMTARPDAHLHTFSHDLVLLELWQIDGFEQPLPSEACSGGTHSRSH